MRTVSILSLMLLVISCNKPNCEIPQPPAPKMMYSNFNDTAIRFQRSASFDLDSNGEMDIFFTTQLVGDPVHQQDKMQWLVNSSFKVNLAVNEQENIPVLNKGDEIITSNIPGYNWFNASSILLAQKILSLTAPPAWDGLWKNVTDRYIAIQVKRDNALFNGWIKISFNSLNEELIVHNAGVSIEPNKTVKAGL